MIINFGISKVVPNPHGKKKIITRNHSIEINVGDRDFTESYPVIREVLKEELKKYPNWHLMGFAQRCEDVNRHL
jgi:hypothetical protein